MVDNERLNERIEKQVLGRRPKKPAQANLVHCKFCKDRSDNVMSETRDERYIM
jgi:hypothetical protein